MQERVGNGTRRFSGRYEHDWPTSKNHDWPTSKFRVSLQAGRGVAMVLGLVERARKGGSPRTEVYFSEVRGCRERRGGQDTVVNYLRGIFVRNRIATLGHRWGQQYLSSEVRRAAGSDGMDRGGPPSRTGAAWFGYGGTLAATRLRFGCQSSVQVPRADTPASPEMSPFAERFRISNLTRLIPALRSLCGSRPSEEAGQC